MLKNFLNIAWRNLVKNKVPAVINIRGIAIGMAVAMLIGLWIYDEISFDKYHAGYDSIAQVMQHQTSSGAVSSYKPIPFLLGKELRNSYNSDFRYRR